MERSEFPICIGEVGWVVCDKVCTIAWAWSDDVSIMIVWFLHEMLLTARLGICITSSPRTTQVDVDNDRLILEVGIDITTRIREVCRCLPPRARIGVVVRNIRWHTPSHEVPYPDASTPPLQSHDTTTGAVVIFSESGIVALDSAARLIICVPVTVFIRGRACLLALVVHFTIRCCVQGHLIARVCKIDGLHDINFAIGWPVGDVGQPESRPGSATMWCMIDVKDEQAFVVCGFGGHSHTIPAGRGCCVSATGTAALLAALIALI